MAQAVFTFEDKISVELEAQTVRILLGDLILPVLAKMALDAGYQPDDGRISFNLIYTDKLSRMALEAGPVTSNPLTFSLDEEHPNIINSVEDIGEGKERRMVYYPIKLYSQGEMISVAHEPRDDVPGYYFARILLVTA